MNIKINGKNYALDFTFNSFKFIEDFDISALNEIDKKPFKMMSITSDLFYGAINCKRDKLIDRETSDKLLEDYIEKNDIIELLESLITLLNESHFFKSLQKKQESPQV